jgi:hypothetical protein
LLVAARRRDLIDPSVAVHHGRIVKRTDDGSLIECRCVVDAVRCAMPTIAAIATARLRAYDAREYARQRRPLCHRSVRQLRPLGRRQRRSPAGDPDSPRDRQTAPLQQLRRQNDLDPPRLAYEATAGRS